MTRTPDRSRPTEPLPRLLCLCLALVSLSPLLLLSGCGDGEGESGEATDAAVAAPVDSGEVPADPRDALVEIPRPSTETFEKGVREQLQEKEAELDAALADDSASHEELARAYGELARHYHVYELHAAAEAAYANAARLDPESFRWVHLLGVVQQSTGSWEEAKSSFSRALEIRPDDVPARVRRGQVLMELDRPDEARRVFEAVLSADPDVALARYFLGQIALQEQDWQRAAEHFEAVKELQPRASVIHYPLSRAYQGLGRSEDARSELEEIGSEEVRLADPLVAELPELSSGAAAYVRRAARAQVDGHLEAAVEEYRRAIGADPENVEARVGLGGVLAELGDLDEALEQTRRALELDDSQLQARYNLAGLLRMKDQPEKAVPAYRRALELDAGHVPSLLGLARAHAAAGDDAAAAEAYGRAAEADDAPQILLEWARLEVGRGNLEQAVELQGRALEGDLPENLRVGALLRQAEWLVAVGRLDDAVGAYGAVLDEAPSDGESGRVARADAHLGRANLRGARGELDGAVEDYARVVEIDPTRKEAWLGRGTALALAGRWQQARAALEQALEAIPGDPDLSHALARILATAPDPAAREGERALELARRALDSGGELAVAETVGMALAELGRWQEAVEWQQQIVRTVEAAEGLPAAEKEAMLQRSRGLLEQYRQKVPVRQ